MLMKIKLIIITTRRINLFFLFQNSANFQQIKMLSRLPAVSHEFDMSKVNINSCVKF